MFQDDSRPIEETPRVQLPPTISETEPLEPPSAPERTRKVTKSKSTSDSESDVISDASQSGILNEKFSRDINTCTQNCETTEGSLNLWIHIVCPT